MEKESKVRFVQMHDAFTPLQMAPIMSLSVEGTRAVAELKETEKGIFVRTKPDAHSKKGRTFIVPLGNISFYETIE